MSTIFKERPESFRASTTATKQPKAKPAQPATAPKPPGLLTKVLSIFDDENEKLARQQQELEAKKGEVAERAHTYKRLKRQRDRAALRLAKADEQFEEAKTGRSELAVKLIRDAWGHDPDLYRTRPPWVGYGHLAALDLAIADFPNVRRHLEEEMGRAQQALNDFRDQYGVQPDVE